MLFIISSYHKYVTSIKISKIGPRTVLSWPKLGLETKFHESGTFFVFFPS